MIASEMRGSVKTDYSDASDSNHTGNSNEFELWMPSHSLVYSRSSDFFSGDYCSPLAPIDETLHSQRRSSQHVFYNLNLGSEKTHSSDSNSAPIDEAFHSAFCDLENVASFHLSTTAKTGGNRSCKSGAAEETQLNAKEARKQLRQLQPTNAASNSLIKEKLGVSSTDFSSLKLHSPKQMFHCQLCQHALLKRNASYHVMSHARQQSGLAAFECLHCDFLINAIGWHGKRTMRKHSRKRHHIHQATQGVDFKSNLSAIRKFMPNMNKICGAYQPTLA